MKSKMNQLIFSKASIKIIMIIVLVVACMMLNGCKNNPSDEEIVAPVTREPAIINTPGPSIEPVERTLDPSPEAEAVTYNISDFFTDEKASVTFSHSQNSSTTNVFSEYSVNKNGGKFIQFKIFSSGKAPEIEIYRYAPDSIKLVYTRNNTPFVYNFLSNATDNGDILLKEPLIIGNSWDVDKGKSTITALGHLVELPIGQVRVVEVTTTMNDDSKIKRLFLEKVGMVAEYDYDKSGKIISTTEALAHDVNRKFEELINVYYASHSKEVFWVPKRSEIESNTSMEDIFKNHLQANPDDMVALGRGVKINKIRLEKDTVRVDFSREMAYMNETANLSKVDERYFLQAIADTFANYYGAAKVYIDINGEPYASSSMVLTENDYFEPNLSETKRY